MKKAELRKLRALPATKEMMEKARKNDRQVTRISYYGSKTTFSKVYGLFFRVQNLAPYIKIAIFFPKELAAGVKAPTYELFINQKGQEYITRELDKSGKEIGWRKAMIDNLPGIDWWQIQQYKEPAYINADGKNSIKALGTKKSGFYGIAEWQQCCRDEQIKAAEEREVKPWDEDMALIPTIPKNFNKWMAKEVPKENFIFYNYERKGAKTGYCTYCEKEVALKEIPTHRKTGTCPECRKKIQYVSRGKIGIVQTDRQKGQMIQKIEDGFAIRQFTVSKKYGLKKKQTTHAYIYETDRWLYRNGFIERYSWESYKNKYIRWVRQKDYEDRYYYYANDECMIWKGNLSKIEDVLGKHTALGIAIKEELRMSAVRYLKNEAGNPAIEKLMKIGMTKLAYGIMNHRYDVKLMDQNQSELTKMLKIDKNRLTRMKQMDLGLKGLMWMQEEKKRNTEYEDQMIRYFDSEALEPSNFDFLKKTELTYKRIQNYLIRQQELSGETAVQVIVSWRDYLEMAKKAKMRVELEQIYKPKNITAAHAEVIELMNKKGIEKQAKERAKQFPNANAVCETLGKYEWADKDYLIVAPKNISDIVREGTILMHCIHTCDYYFDRINKREAYLLFLRHKETPDTPWYTLEVEPGGNIRQKRTTGDKQNEDLNKAMPFLKKWQKEIQKRLSEEDKKLAEESEKKRIENIELLRKNGNRIWHGKLQGQLLADVLEEDFMSVI